MGDWKAVYLVGNYYNGCYHIKTAGLYIPSVKSQCQDFATWVLGQTKSIDVLINNAGFGTSGRFAEEDRARVQQEIVLNVATLVDLTAAYLPKMLKRNSGAIVNIASTASYQPVPGMAVYAATKAFVRSFTSAVWGEVKGTNVRVLTVSPGATATEFFDVAKAKSMGKLAPIQDVVSATFKALNAKRSKPAIIVGRQNAVMAFASRLFSVKFIIGVAASMFLNKK